jgi:alpha-ketoglutarate-dependent taurine dioxygenase
MISFDSAVKCEFVNSEMEYLLTIKPQIKNFNYLEWIQANKHAIEAYFIKFGGVILRNFINSISEFNKVAQVFCPNLVEYVYRSTPRNRLGGKIYTATEYPADRIIPLHNENSYATSWPEKIFFFSAIVASEGGETPIADSRKVYKRINQSIREKFEQTGVLYVRNYTPGIDLSWQEVFQTSDKEEVNRYCREHDIEADWNKTGPELTTKQICQASIVHPISGERVWFNQAHLFHISSLEERDRLTLTKELGMNYLPRNAFYGNGQPIEIEVLEHIRKAYEQEKIKFKWSKGDIMILDNILTAHGRETYQGERKVAVAMA